MANNKRSGGKTIGLKIYAVITSLLIAASAVVVGVGFGTGLWQVVLQDDPVQEQPDDQTPDETPEDEGGMIVGEPEEQGISLMSARIAPADYEEYGISPMAESAQQLKATITPSNATNQKVDWAVAWVNPSSSWANGKTVTDYVTVTPTADGSLTAIVECKQAFGEQVKVTVASRQNTKATASSTVDYAKRVTSGTINYTGTNTGNVNITSSGSEFTYTASGTLEDNTINTSSVFTPVMGTGTLDDEFTYDITVSYNEAWGNALTSNSFGSYIENAGKNIPLSTIGTIYIGTVMGLEVLSYTGEQAVYEDYMYGSNGAFNAFADALRDMDGESIFTLKVVATGT